MAAAEQYGTARLHAFFHFLNPLIIAVLIAVMPLPINLFGVLLAVALLWGTIRLQGWSASIMPTAVIAITLTTATFAPFKSMARVYEMPIQLPKQSLTLGELAQFTEASRGTRCPISVSWSLTPAQSQTAVRFNSTEVSVQEFLATIESQTSLRPRFAYCGNGWTLLCGYNASGMVSLR
ncbi:hypothetical protein NA78x_002274 [Anatilimnocola sp. NA78]|uniref:hypothetical protein n=1 Tax=Anatilimnocola sp. NA78 TaxID=3415683 RepID=UPI003CE50AE1